MNRNGSRKVATGVTLKSQGRTLHIDEKSVAEFDKEFIVDTFGPLTPEDRARWKRVKARRGRPRKGKGVKVISVSIEMGLLKRTDRLAKRKGVPRASLIAAGLEAVLAHAS